MSDRLAPYETGLAQLGQQLRVDHARYLEFVELRSALQRNIAQARDRGDGRALTDERARIVERLNQLASESLKVSFDELCGLGRYSPVLTVPLVKLRPPALLFLSAVAAAVLGLILRPAAAACLPCVPALVATLSLGVPLLALIQLIWRCLHPILRATSGRVSVAWLELPLDTVTWLADALHPWGVSTPALWSLALVLCAAGALVLSPLSPFPPPPEEALVVQRFAVEYLDRDGAPVSVKPGGAIELAPDERAMVRAEVLGQPGRCQWSASVGAAQRAEGCAAVYTAPFHAANCILSVYARSVCRTQSATASLRIRIVPSNP